MHPDIREFWEKRNNEIREKVSSYDNEPCIYYVAYKDNKEKFGICIKKINSEFVTPYWGFGIFGAGKLNHWYSEKDMLKIIALKAFI